MGYGGIDFENVDADKIKEQYEQLKAEREEREEREENKGTLDRINDTISGIIDGNAIRNAMGETYGNSLDMNPTTYRPLGKIEDIAGDVVDAVQTHTQQRQEFLHNAADMQEKAMNGQLTEEDIDNLRQSGRNARVSLANIAAAPFRQAARNMIQNHAGDNTSPWQPLAQSLEKTDVAQEYFMTPAEKAQKSREMEQALGLPAESTLADNDTYREALEIYNFKQKADTMEEVWERYPELQTIAKDDKEGAVLALHNIRDVKETRSVVDTFMSFLEKGNTELEYNNLQYKIMMGRASEEEKTRAADLKKQIDSSRKLETPGFFQDPLGRIAADVAGSLPEMGQSVKEGLEGGGVALTLASVAAAVISGGSSVAATAGFAAVRAAVARALASQAGRNLIKTGVYSGLIHGMAAPESGKRYTEYKAMTKADGKTPLYTDDEARTYALIGGYGNAAIEIANIGVIGKAVYPVATRVFAQSVEQIAKQSMGRETIKDLALGRMGDWFKLTASESGEEALQSVADDVLGNIALASKGEEGAHYKQYSAYDIVTRAGQSFIESLPASMGFATLGTGAGTITGAGRLVRARKRAADMERTLGRQQTQTMMGVMAVEQLQKAVEQGNLNKVAPDVQKKILKEQLANTDFARAYIDVEMAIQKENGREDLQKVAEAAGMSTDELEAAITVNGFIPVETETLAQAKVSPDLLDSVSFSENADSMARMRENSKTIVDDYKKNFEKMVEHQKALADTIIKNYLPENASTKQKETLRAIMLDNPNNPAQAWNKWRKTYNDELQQLIAPALDALKRGMGNAGIMEVEDEQGNKKTQRYTENDEWYRNFYKAFKRKPTAAELQDMAIAMTIGDSNAPKVAGWIPNSAEAQAEMEKNRPIIEGLKNNIELLDSIKSEAKKLTGVEMELTQGLSPEAFKVYRALSGWANKAGGKIARAGRISAILVARHADLFAETIRKNTGTNYTAEDYIRQRLGFQLIAADGTINEDALKQQSVGGMAAEFVKLTSEDMPDVPSGKVVATETLTPIDAAMAAFEKEYPDGETIETPIGDVNINKKGIKASFNHGKIYQAKLDVVPYLVEGMKKAAYLGFEKDFDNRTIVNHYFTFPIMYDGVKRFVFCRVRFPAGGKKSFYVHEVFTQDEIKEKSQSLQTQPIPYEKVRQLRGLALYKYILANFYGKNNVELLETLFQRAWVGSPADFNKFDLGYVGTGEGTQAHGYGLYSAADRKVAEGYRKRLAGTIKMPTFEEIKVDGVSLQDMLDSAIDNGELEKQAMLENYETYNRQEVLRSAKEEGFDQEYIDWFNKLADKVEKHLPEQPGKLYEVEIPDNDVLLDEQKPLSQQPEKVKEAIINILAEDIIIDTTVAANPKGR